MTTQEIFKQFTLGGVVAMVTRCHLIELIRKAAGDVYSVEAQRAVLNQVVPGLGDMDLDRIVELGNEFKTKLEMNDSVYDDKDLKEVQGHLLAFSKPSDSLVSIKGQQYSVVPHYRSGADFEGDVFNV